MGRNFDETFRRVALLALLVSATAHGQIPSSQSTSYADFITDSSDVVEGLETGGFNQVLIASASALFFWRDSPWFPDLSKKVITTYGFLADEELRQRFEFLHADLEGTTHGLGWLETGLVAMALGDVKQASACFAQIASNGELATNPYPKVLLGKSAFAAGDVATASQAYEEALEFAGENTDNRFRVRYEFALDLLAAGELDDAQAQFTNALVSESTLEQTWANEELLLLAWAAEDITRVVEHRNRLLELLPAEEIPKGAQWELRRQRTAKKVLDRASKAIEGDLVAMMALDEESTVYDFRGGDYQKSLDRLGTWVETNRLTEIDNWSVEKRHVVTCTHLVQGAAYCMLGQHDQALEVFDHMIDHIPSDEPRGMLVKAWCWKGYTLLMMGNQEDEARRCYETGLRLDGQASGRTSPADLLQRRIPQGKVPPQVREQYVANYASLIPQSEPE